MNKVIILGRLGADPELKETKGGFVCKLSVATSEKWSGDNGPVERTEWHSIVIWGKLAEICAKYLRKGSQAVFEGRIQTRSWDDESGARRYATEIVANNVQFLGSKKSEDDDSGELPL